jgi:hypothetical protein
MHKLVAFATAGAVSFGAIVLSVNSYAAVGPAVGSGAIDAAIGPIASVEKVGCYRWGETGYHWYRFCFGPAFIYPHQRVCRHGYCWYR